MTWTLSISCLLSVIENEENLFERFDRNAPEYTPRLRRIVLTLSYFILAKKYFFDGETLC
jgi:hypothetical protein